MNKNPILEYVEQNYFCPSATDITTMQATTRMNDGLTMTAIAVMTAFTAMTAMTAMTMTE